MGMGEVPNGNLDTTTALIYDSVTAFAIALNKLDTVQQVICSYYDMEVKETYDLIFVISLKEESYWWIL